MSSNSSSSSQESGIADTVTTNESLPSVTSSSLWSNEALPTQSHPTLGGEEGIRIGGTSSSFTSSSSFASSSSSSSSTISGVPVAVTTKASTGGGGLTRFRAAANLVATSQAFQSQQEKLASNPVLHIISAAKVSSSRFRSLVSKELIQTAKDNEAATPLHWCCYRGDIDDVQLCLDHLASIEARTITGQTPLHWAVIQGHIPIVKLLLAYGADINGQDSLGATPLIVATQYKHMLLWLFLIDHNADLNITDINGCGIAHWAAFTGNLTVMQALYRKYSLVSSSIGYGSNSAGGNNGKFDETDNEGCYPLHRAAKGGQLEIIQYLIDECGIDSRLRMRSSSSSTNIPSSSRTSNSSPLVKDEITDALTAAGQAQNALRIILSTNPLLTSNEPIPPSQQIAYTNAKILMDRQQEIIQYCLNQQDKQSYAESSPLGKWLWIIRYRLPDIRVRSRLFAPVGFLLLHVCFFLLYLWFYKDKVSLTVGCIYVLLIMLNLYLYHRVYTMDAGTLDPYRILGTDGWIHVTPRLIFSQLCSIFSSSSSSSSVNLFRPLALLIANVTGSNHRLLFPLSLAFSRSRSHSRNDTGDNSSVASDGERTTNTSPVRDRKGSETTREDTFLSSDTKTSSTDIDVTNTLINIPSSHSPIERLINDVNTEINEWEQAIDKIPYCENPTVLARSVHRSLALRTIVPPLNSGTLASRVTNRICYTCGILPKYVDRAVHDPITDRCYYRYDHHSYWAGNVIAQTNYVYYIVLIFIQILVSIFTVTLSFLWADATAAQASEYKLFASAVLRSGTGSTTESNGSVSSSPASSSSIIRTDSGLAFRTERIDEILHNPSTVYDILVSHWFIAVFLFVQFIIILRCTLALIRHLRNVGNNITTYESEHLGDNEAQYGIFWKITTNTTGMNNGTNINQQQQLQPNSSTDLNIVPEFRNPFSRGSPELNYEEILLTPLTQLFCLRGQRYSTNVHNGNIPSFTLFSPPLVTPYDILQWETQDILTSAQSLLPRIIQASSTVNGRSNSSSNNSNTRNEESKEGTSNDSSVSLEMVMKRLYISRMQMILNSAWTIVWKRRIQENTWYEKYKMYARQRLLQRTHGHSHGNSSKNDHGHSHNGGSSSHGHSHGNQP